MGTYRKPLFELTAGDLMCRNLVAVREGMPLRDAARFLIRTGVQGMPVVDARGRCVGVLSVTDLARWGIGSANPPLRSPPACSHQDRLHALGGTERVLCRLPDGACTLQGHDTSRGGGTETVCRDPDGVPTDWQVVSLEVLPVEDVRHHMTADTVTVGEEAGVREVARLMTDAHVHRVVVVDAEGRPVGVVSGTDLIAALVHAPAPDEVPLGRPV